MKELIKLNIPQYGLQESKAKDIENLYFPMIKMLSEMENEFNELVSRELTEDLQPDAKVLRIRIAKIRISADKARKEGKSEYLRAGNAIQGAYNTLAFAVQSKEAKLLTIENHFENLKKEIIEQLKNERLAELSKYDSEMIVPGIGEMKETVWGNFFAGVKSSFEIKKAAEKQAEKERIENDKLDRLDYRRKEKANRYRYFWNMPGYNFRKMTNEQFNKLIELFEKTKVKHEAEQERIRIENDRLKKEAEIKEKQRQIELAAIEKENKKRKEKEAEVQKQFQIKLDTERKEKQRIENELQAKKNAELKFIEDAKKEAAKKAKAPDKEKIVLIIEGLEFPKQKFTTIEAEAIFNVISQKFESFKNWAIKQTESI